MKAFLAMLFTWWGETTFGTWVHTLRRGSFVGEDSFGNRYYKQSVPRNASYSGSRKGERRWVVYADPAEASAIPPQWHGWMHYRADEPAKDEERPHDWQRPHQPNRTGTPDAYRPDGSLLTPQRRKPVSGDYEAWTP